MFACDDPFIHLSIYDCEVQGFDTLTDRRVFGVYGLRKHWYCNQVPVRCYLFYYANQLCFNSLLLMNLISGR